MKEIAKTGQLTTSKMFNRSDLVKKINMKIAGTLTKNKLEEQKVTLNEPVAK